MAFAAGAFERGLAFLLGLEHFAEGLAQFARQHHVAHFDGVDLHADGLGLRRDEFAELRADGDTLGEQRFHRDASDDGADGRLRRAVDVRLLAHPPTPTFPLRLLGGYPRLARSSRHPRSAW